jgi:hypothetical protein
METGRYYWVPCTIENAGFASERRFEVDLPQGDGRVVGAADVEHFRSDQRQPLPEGQPPYGQSMKGFVRCRVLRREQDKLFIEFPGTEVFHVPKEALSESWQT